MITLTSGEIIRILYDGEIIPLSQDTIINFEIVEDMGAFFVIGKFEFTDPLSLFLGIHEIRTGKEIELLITVGNNDDHYKFIVTEMGLGRDAISQLNQISIIFMSMPFKFMTTPEYSRGFGNVLGTAVLKDILDTDKSGFDSLQVDSSGNKNWWIQAYMTNQEMVKYIAKHSRSVYAGVGDYCYFMRRDNIFCFKSEYKMYSGVTVMQLSNYRYGRGENSEVFTMLSIAERSDVYLSQGGYGNTTFYYDEKRNEYRKHERGLDKMKLKDGARNLGFFTDIEDRYNRVYDFGFSGNFKEKDIRVLSDYKMLKALMLAKEVEVPVRGYFKDVHIGDVVELIVYVDKDNIDDVYTGKYLIVGNTLTIRTQEVVTVLRLYRLGFNNRRGRVIE